MIKGEWVVIVPCVNQDTGKFLNRGDIIRQLSEGEYGRLKAFANIEDVKKIEKKQNDKKRKTILYIKFKEFNMYLNIRYVQTLILLNLILVNLIVKV